MKNTYSLPAGARQQAQRNQQIDEMSDQDFEQHGNWLGFWIVVAIVAIVIVAAMYGYSRYTSVLTE